MKKLLCLIIVVLISSIVSAGFTESGVVDYGWTIEGDVLSISFISEYPILNFTFGKLTDEGAGGTWSSTNMYFNPKFTDTAEVYVASDFGMGDAGTLVLGMAAAAPGEANAATGVLATFEYTILTPVKIFKFLEDINFGYGKTVEYYDGSGGTAVEVLTDIYIPEPMTIALLGLGGLFIRRRK